MQAEQDVTCSVISFETAFIARQQDKDCLQHDHAELIGTAIFLRSVLPRGP